MLNFKKPEADLRKSYTVYVQIGMVVTLGLLLVVFNVNFKPKDQVVIKTVEQETVKMEDVVQTKQVQKPPPPPRPPVPVAVPNDEVIDDAPVDLDAELDLDAPIDMPPPPPPAEDKKEPEVFVAVENPPQIKGGMQEVYKHITYPEIARKAGIEGRVILQFVVDEHGNVKNIQVLRGIDVLNQAAIDAAKQLHFRPGLQRGRPVKVRFTLPIIFKLQN